MFSRPPPPPVTDRLRCLPSPSHFNRMTSISCSRCVCVRRKTRLACVCVERVFVYGSVLFLAYSVLHRVVATHEHKKLQEDCGRRERGRVFGCASSSMLLPAVWCECDYNGAVTAIHIIALFCGSFFFSPLCLLFLYYSVKPRLLAKYRHSTE